MKFDLGDGLPADTRGFSMRRLASAEIAQPATTPVFTKQTFAVKTGTKPVASDQSMGMFFYI